MVLQPANHAHLRMSGVEGGRRARFDENAIWKAFQGGISALSTAFLEQIHTDNTQHTMASFFKNLFSSSNAGGAQKAQKAQVRRRCGRAI